MAKSMRSKSKRAFRRHKREDGVYAATHAARLERLSAKLAAKVSADKDGDQAMEEEEEEDNVEGGGERLSNLWHLRRGVDAIEELCDIHEGVTGGEDNLNIDRLCELMALMSLDKWTEDGDVEMEELDCLVAGLSLVYDGDGDVEMMDLCQSPLGKDAEMDGLCQSGQATLDSDIELCEPMPQAADIEESCEWTSQLGIHDSCSPYNNILLWCHQVAEETYEDDDESSVGDELITPEQLPLDSFEEGCEDNPLFQHECNDVAQACAPRPLFAAGPSHADYPPLFEEGFRYEVPWLPGGVGVYAPEDGGYV